MKTPQLMFAITSAMLICMEAISPESNLTLLSLMWLVSFSLCVIASWIEEQ